MMLAKVCRATLSPQVTSLLKAPVVPRLTNRLFASDGRTAFRRSAVRKTVTVAERAAAPAGETGKLYLIIEIHYNLLIFFLIFQVGYY